MELQTSIDGWVADRKENKERNLYICRSDVRFVSAKEPEDKARSKNFPVILVATIERTNESRCSKRGLQDDVNNAVRDERRNRGKMLEAL